MAVLQRHKSTIYGLVNDLSTLTTNISNEASARIAGDAALQSELDATQVGAGLGTGGAYTANGSANYIASAVSLQDADNDLDAQIKLNTDAIDALDTASTGDLSDEIAARIAADAALQADIDQNEADSDAAESALQTELDDTQAGAGLGTDGSYSANAGANFISTSTSLVDADNDLDTALKAEETARGAADTTLQSNIDAEETARIAADNTLQSNIDSEESARISADGTLTTNLAQEVADRATADDLKVDLAGDTMGGSLDFDGTYKVTGLASPTQDGDATNKLYVDSLISGVDWKDSVLVATDGAITLSGLQNIDGVTVAADDRVLVKDQADAKDNGIYSVVDGAWTRAEDFDDTPGSEVTAGNAVFVESGTKYSNTGFVLQGQGDLVLDTHDLDFVQFTSLGQVVAGAGIVKDGNELYLQFGAGTKELPNDEIGLDIHTSGGLYMTEDGSTESLLADAQVSILLNDSDLELTANGLAITAAYKTSVSDATALVQTNLDTEEAARIAADNTLQTNIDNEETARIAADAVLQGNIDAEESARISAVSAVQADVDQNETDSDAADTALQAELDGTQAEIGTVASLSTTATTVVGAINEIDLEIGDITTVSIEDGSSTDIAGMLNDLEAAKMDANDNLSDLTNLVTARSNLSVYSTTEVDNAIAAGGAVFVTETLTVGSDAITLSEVAKSDMLFNFNTVRHTDANFVSYDIPATVSAAGSKTYNLSPNSSGEFDGLSVVVQYAYVPAA